MRTASRPASRELWITSGVLVPFAILVVLGLAWPPPPAPVPAQQAEPSPPQTSPPQTSLPQASGRLDPRQPRSPTDDARPGALDGTSRRPRPPVDARSEPHSRYPVELDAPLEAVEVEVQRCLFDQGTRAPRQIEIEVAFRPTRSGTFEAVAVHPSWHDPYLEACVEDVFAEVHWVPSGRETFAPASYTFQLSR